MDVTSYFQNVLSTSYMVRVRFNGADYETTTGGDDARKKGKGATRGRRKKSEERYTSYKANGDALTDGVLPSETLESLLSKLSKFDRQAAERGETLAESALAWVLEQPGVTSVIVGVSRVEQLAVDLKAIAKTS